MRDAFLALISNTYPAYITKTIEKMARSGCANRGYSFDSHDFIRIWAQKHQELYLMMLIKYKSKPTVGTFRKAHEALAKLLLRHPGQVQPVRNVISEDIFGDKVSCKAWRDVTRHSNLR